MNRRQFIETASLIAAGLCAGQVLGAGDAAFSVVRTPPAR